MAYAPIVLASESPRRAELLRQIGVPFDAAPSGASESYPDDLTPAQGAEYVARAKALAVAESLPAAAGYAAVLGADTMVIIDGRSLGKPRSAVEAIEMLHRLSGRTHEVVTGVALVWLDMNPDDETRVESWYETTSVTFRPLRQQEILAYVQSGGPLDKAGAYGIQEGAAAFVSRIEGCYFNVVGLPLASLAERLQLVD
ncbi:septum formation protein Maf [Candidatus Poribacteria bacterium]|nr:septum formation protein Maf [Candidatus Poribacteria bacterium]